MTQTGVPTIPLMCPSPPALPELTLQQLQRPPYSTRLERLEWRMLLCHVLQLSRTSLITQDQRPITGAELAQLDKLCLRREQGEPMAYLLGQREFYGLDFIVSPAVLIPRPETELLVELALAHLPAPASHPSPHLSPHHAPPSALHPVPDSIPPARLLDMGTGSGALAVALAHTRPNLQVFALDASPAALAIARQNAARHQVVVEFIESDWYAAVPPQRRFNLIVANPPYIVAGDPHLQQGDLRFEPLDALTDHQDGLSSLRQIIAGAPPHLERAGWLLMEHGYDQAQSVRALLAGQQDGGFTHIQSWRDLAGIERVTGAQWVG